MIIQIRGTSGSGKTWVMRQVIEAIAPLDSWEKQYVVGRKKPETYRHRSIYVLGHYESACGGCDNIGSAAAVYSLLQKLNQFGSRCLILCEGLLLSEDVKWSSQLEDLHVYFLTTATEKCLDQIRSRRVAVGNDKELNPHNTVNRVEVIERARSRLESVEGVTCRRCPASQAVSLITKQVKDFVNG